MEDLGRLVGDGDFEEQLLEKLFEGMIFHRFEWVDDIYEAAFGFDLFSVVDEDTRNRIYTYRDMRHKILHGTSDDEDWSVIDEDKDLERAVNDVLEFSTAVFDAVVSALGLNIV